MCYYRYGDFEGGEPWPYNPNMDYTKGALGHVSQIENVSGELYVVAGPRGLIWWDASDCSAAKRWGRIAQDVDCQCFVIGERVFYGGREGCVWQGPGAPFE